MNQEYRGGVERHLASGGDPKYVNVKKKAEARHSEAKAKALGKAKHGLDTPKAKWGAKQGNWHKVMPGDR